jgi:hypothetical protein
MSQGSTKSITDKLINQCINLFNTSENQSKLRTSIIDPLVAYFQRKLRLFYVVIILLICLMIIAFLILAYQVASLRNIVLGLRLQLQAI